MNASDIISDALKEAGILAAGESPSAEDAEFGLNKLNRLLDNWNAESLYCYSSQISDFTLTPHHNPHTIGLAANAPDFVVTGNRPPVILKADLILTDVSPNIYRPMNLVDDAWWLNNPVPTLETQIPYYLFYNEGWPNGQIYLWPVPATAYGLRLMFWTALTQLALYDPFTLPPGYQDAVTLSLAESLAPAFGVPPAPTLMANAAKARERIRSLNAKASTMACDPAAQSMDSRPRASIANMMSGFFN